VKVSLPPALEEFVSSQIKSGEYDNASAVVGDALRLLRQAQESTAMEEMRHAFRGADSRASGREPRSGERSLINDLVKSHRAAKTAPRRR
jgi:putative addiction module CopG family antidote